MASDRFFPNRKLVYWACQVGGWGLLFLLSIFLSSFTRQLETPALLYLGTLSVLGIFISHGYRHLIVHWGWLDMAVMRQLTNVLVASLLLSVLTFVIHSAMVYLALGADFFQNYPNQPKGSGSGNLVLALFNIASAYFFWSVIYFLFHYIISYNKGLKWQATSKEVELNRLKAQLNPHFIFNALNSVRALVDEDPVKAKMSITQLSNIMRSSLIMDRRKTTSFEEEMRTVRDYLGLEAIRFEERLQVEYDIHPDSANFDVPPMMVQTLVENGIKHGISKLVGGGVIRIEAKVVDETLVLRIFNSGNYEESVGNEDSAGYGLLNTVQRLKLIYDGQATFSISNYRHDCVLTEVHIPDLGWVVDKGK